MTAQLPRGDTLSQAVLKTFGLTLPGFQHTEYRTDGRSFLRMGRPCFQMMRIMHNERLDLVTEKVHSRLSQSAVCAILWGTFVSGNLVGTIGVPWFVGLMDLSGSWCWSWNRGKSRRCQGHRCHLCPAVGDNHEEAKASGGVVFHKCEPVVSCQSKTMDGRVNGAPFACFQSRNQDNTDQSRARAKTATSALCAFGAFCHDLTPLRIKLCFGSARNFGAELVPCEQPTRA